MPLPFLPLLKSPVSRLENARPQEMVSICQRSNDFVRSLRTVAFEAVHFKVVDEVCTTFGLIEPLKKYRRERRLNTILFVPVSVLDKEAVRTIKYRQSFLAELATHSCDVGLCGKWRGPLVACRGAQRIVIGLPSAPEDPITCHQRSCQI